MSSKRQALVLSAIALTLTAAGCGGDEESSSSTASATSKAPGKTADVPFTGSLEEGIPVGYDEPEPKDLTIGFASALDANELVNVQGRAIKLEVEKLGGEFVLADAQGNPDKQVSDVEQLVARKVDAIIVFPLDAKALDPALEKAEAADIPVVGIEADLSKTTPPAGYDSQLWQRRDRLSYLQAAEAAKVLPEGGKFGQIGFAVPVPTIERSIERAKFWAEKFGLSSVGRTDNQTDDIAGGEKAMTELLGQNQDLQGLIAYNEESATGAQASARQQGKRDLPLIGANGGSLGFESVKSGRITATVQFQTPDNGRFAAWGAYQLANGADVPETVMGTEPKLVNKDNVDSVQTWEQTLQERYGKAK